MRIGRALLICAVLVVMALPTFGQGTSGQLTGNVTSNGNPVPGVTITVTSPSLQGSRSTVTGDAGGFSIAGLPPGQYDVMYELEGLQRLTRKVRVELAQTSRSDADLKVAAVAESVTVTATAPTVLETPQAATTFDANTIDHLPVSRTIRDTVLLAPGVNDAGPNNQIVISGAQSFDNLFLVNGVVVNENLRGQPQNVYIEDAIEETTVLRGSISAEYGRFTGGVVTTLTKSGGNQFSGSFRDTLVNQDWKAKTPFAGEAAHLDKINPIYEATLGGRIIRDRLWFFAAGRNEDTSTNAATIGTNIPYTREILEDRYEGKLTGQVWRGHDLVVSYARNNRQGTNTVSNGNIVDLRSLVPDKRPSSILSLRYGGVLTSSLLLEGQFSHMNFHFVNGAESRDMIQGTLLRDSATGRRAWSATFCGTPCPPKERDNRALLGKASYFLSTNATGNHSVVGGWEDFHQKRNENNYQSGSDFRIHGIFHYDGPNVYFGVDPNAGNEIEWDPVPALSQTSDFAVRSVFVNDKWDLSNRWNFNLGARYDQAYGSDQAGNKTVDDSAISPRLSATYDLTGNAKHRITASYSKYVSKVDQGPADLTATAGRYASYYWDYKGPAINPRGTPISQMVPTEDVIRRVFEWFQTVGGTNNREFLTSAHVPGITTKFEQSLRAPSMDEVAIGYGLTLGRGGYFRIDAMHRDWKDFYTIRRTLETGRATDANGSQFDVGVIENASDGLNREYDGVQLQASYRLFSIFNLGGNYTWSKLRGNVEGETAGFATGFTDVENYPQYTAFGQNNPVGYLNADMRHRAQAWVDVMPPIGFGELSLSVLQRFHSGLPYSAQSTIDVRQNSTLLPNGIANPGYVIVPTAVAYYFGERGSLRAEDVFATDVALRYTIPIRNAGVTFLFDVNNILNNEAIEDPDFIEKTVRTRRNGATFPSGAAARAFNPFTETPVEGVHYEKVATFGTPISASAYQVPRTYLLAARIRF